MTDASQSSVVIPTYLRPTALNDCVCSILAGNLKPSQIIIVGRESDHDTRRVVEDLCSMGSGLTSVRSAWVTVPGHIPPFEAGLRLASTKFVAFLDDDVTVTRAWMEVMLRHFIDPSVGVVGGRVVVPGAKLPRRKGKPGRVTWYGKTWGNVASMDGDRVAEVDAVMEGNCIWRRDLLNSLHLDSLLNFDDASMYGLDLCLQAKDSGYRVLYDPRGLVYHHVKPRAPELDRAQRPARTFSYCRNYTYIMLKRLPAWRKLLFLTWWFAVGERAAVGLAAWVANAVSGRGHQPEETRLTLTGKVEGIRLWWRHRGARSG